MHRRIGSGSPLMLVHGYLGGQFMWQFQEPLQDDFELIMPSLAGVWRKCSPRSTVKHPR